MDAVKNKPAKHPGSGKSPYKPVNVAIFGHGRWGMNLVRQFNLLPESNLALVCDPDPAKQKAVTSLYPDVKLAPEQVVLNDDSVEAVVIASPAPLHYKQAKAALAAGKHVLVEKPITLDVDEANNLIKLASKVNKILAVGHLLIYHPAITLIKSIIEAGDIGDVYYLYSQRLNLGTIRQDENALWSLAPHDVSLALHLTDKKPVQVTASGQSCLNKNIEDVVFITILFEDGLISNSHVSWLDPQKTRKLTIVGSKKMIVFDDMAEAEPIKIYDKGVDFLESDQLDNPELTLREGEVSTPIVDPEKPLAIECRHFLDCVRNGQRPIADGKNGLQVLQVLRAAQSSLDQDGHPVEIKGFSLD